jgi:hypothetical protein
MRNFTNRIYPGKWLLFLVMPVLMIIPGTSKIQPEQSISISNQDPLPSWNDGALKKSIISFVVAANTKANAGFIPVETRIATFDNDGTLWPEKPLVQELYAFFIVKKMTAKHPELAGKQPYKAVLENDKGYFEKGGMKAVMELFDATHTGITEEEFDANVQEFFATVKYPGRNVPISQILYQPQLELLAFLRDNGFKIFLCSGGTIEFMRAISVPYYGIPKEQVIGSVFNYEFIDSTSTILRKPGMLIFNDQAVKPTAIQMHIGQRPVFACGNEGGHGDIAMLKYSQGSKYPTFQMIINHDDAAREFLYQEKDSLSLKAAAKNKWHVVSMKDDWKKIYPGKK